MNNIIQCQVKQIEPVNNFGKIKVHLLPLEENQDIINSTGFQKADDGTFGINWKNELPMPSWLKQGNKIKMPYKMYLNYVTLDAGYNNQDIDKIQVLEEANVVDKIKDAFPDATLENIPDGLDELEKETDFPYGANEKKPNGTDKLNGHSDDPVQAKINNYADLYAKIFATIHKHEYLQKLDTGLKKDIATSFFIQLNR